MTTAAATTTTTTTTSTGFRCADQGLDPSMFDGDRVSLGRNYRSRLALAMLPALEHCDRCSRADECFALVRGTDDDWYFSGVTGGRVFANGEEVRRG